MKKIALGPQTLLYPMPAFLIGANVNGRPNFMTAAWCGIANSEPPMLTVAVRPHRHTYKGLKQNNTFSVNVPSMDLVKEVDYCGIFSGNKEDKVYACSFTVFYGKLKTAPLIQECPVSLECQVAQELNLPSHALFIAYIEETHVSEACLTDGKPDIDKIKPIAYGTGAKRAYYALGKMLAQAFSVGSGMRNR